MQTSKTINPVNTNVVLNNNLPSLKSQTVKLLTVLSTQREDWEANAYRTSKLGLYAILQKCYALDWEISHSICIAKELRDGIKEYEAHLSYSFKVGTPFINRIVRCVFGNAARSRISTYSTVLKEAKKQNITIADIPSFIENAGGVQEIRLSKSKTFVSAKQKIELISQTVFNEVLAVAKSPSLTQLAVSDYVDEQCILLATQQADGTFAINAVVRGKGVVNTALVALYGQTSTTRNDDLKKREAANDSDIRMDLVKKIVHQN
ncbi:hypothetical protein MCEKH45_00092 [Methylophilaceae bacterium]